MFKRRALPKGIRHEVFKRDSYKCTECGKGKDVTTLEVDHIMSISKGGTDEMSNLRTLCFICNREKNDLVHENKNSSFISEEFKIIKDDVIKCPICQGGNNHPVHLQIQLSDRLIFIANNEITQAKIPSKKTGVEIVLWYTCEEGHAWSQKQEFHEGITFETVNTLPKAVYDDYGYGAIWRD